MKAEGAGIARLLGASLIALAANAAAQQEPPPGARQYVVPLFLPASHRPPPPAEGFVRLINLSEVQLAASALGEGVGRRQVLAAGLAREIPEMVRIPGGTFTQGAPVSERWSDGDERPQRRVSVPAFEAGRYEVTFSEWDACVDAGGCGGHRPDDRGWGRGDRPVIGVNWHDAQGYVEWLSSCTGDRYRLLTESEWEYAARAGTTTPFHTGETITSSQANFYGRVHRGGLYRGQTVPVGSFAPNRFGLHDMHGNVWEWVQDCYGGYEEAPSDGSAVEGTGCGRVLRGGSWFNSPRPLRSADRYRYDSGDRNLSSGFRVARTLTP